MELGHREAPAPPILRADKAATAQRLRALRDYMDEHVLGPQGFCCASFAACRDSLGEGDRFFEGQLSHMGCHFDLFRDGRPLRVVVVGQEDGGTRTCVSLKERYEQIHDRSGLARRYYTDSEHRPRNPHMRGTTSALRVIFGKGLGKNWDEEFIQTSQGEPFHIFDGFALVNVLLCGAHPPESARGRATKVMRCNCLRHFEATMKILQPTLLVLQGYGVLKWLSPVLGVMDERAPYLSEACLAGRRVLVCRFSHPSAPDRSIRWGDCLNAPYLLEVVEPTLRLAVSLL